MRKSLALLLLVLTFAPAITARPLIKHPFARQVEKRKLPPVNWIRSRNIDVKHVSIDLRFDWEKESAYGSTVVTLAPFVPLNRVELDAAAMSIKAVSLVGGEALKFNYNADAENNNLEVFLNKLYGRGEELAIRIEYATQHKNTADADTAIGSFGRGLRFIKPTSDRPDRPRQIWSQGETEFNRYWFPSYDSPNDFRTSELKATVEKPFIAVSNGTLINTTENTDGTRTFHWKMDVPYTNYLTSIVVGEYADVKQEFQGIPISNFGYVNETREVAATVKNIPDMMSFFSEKIGMKYPYTKYAQAMVEDFGGGMENITATTMIEEMIHDERTLLDEDSDSLQAHELAHQWFGNLVTCRDWGQIWLNESFATYLDAAYAEHKKGHAEFLYANIRDYQDQYLDSWNSELRRPIVTKNFGSKDAMFDTYAYARGAAVLHMLRKHLGDDLFWRSLNHYLKSNLNQPVSTEDLRIAVEEVTGQSMDWFFDQWLYRMGHPIFEVTSSYDVAKKQVTLTAVQTQKIDTNDEYPQVEFFEGFVDISIDDRVERVWLKPQASNSFTFEASTQPKLVHFDRESTLIKEMKFEKTTDELVYQALNDSDVLGRDWAIGQLELRTQLPAERDKALTAMGTVLQRDKFWRIRRSALAAVNRIVTEEPGADGEPPPVKLDKPLTEAIRALTSDENSLVRGESLALLGATQDARYEPQFIKGLSDPSYYVIANAANALAFTKSKNAYGILTKLAEGTTWRNKVEISALGALSELADKRSLDAAIAIASDKARPPAVRNSALQLVGSVGKGDKRAFPLIFESFKIALEKEDFNSLIRSLNAIIELGDPRGQEAFDLMKLTYKDQPELLGGVTFFETLFKESLKKK